MENILLRYLFNIPVKLIEEKIRDIIPLGSHIICSLVESNFNIFELVV
jgi:hypothetical protein